MQTNTLFYLGVLALLVLLSGWLLATVQSVLRTDAPHNAQAPLLTIDQAQAVALDPQGVRKYTLTAPRLVHLPGEQGTRVEAPVIEVFQKDGLARDWLIRAERGWMSADNRLVRLEERVSLTRSAAGGNTSVAITARNVSVRPREGYAESAEAVRAQTPNGELSGVGFKAHLHEQQVELLSQVRGTYAPPKR